MVQGQVALVEEMALRAYPTVHWLSGHLNSGFECIKRLSPQQTHTQLNCLRNTYLFCFQRIFAETGHYFTLTIGQCVHRSQCEVNEKNDQLSNAAWGRYSARMNTCSVQGKKITVIHPP